MNILILSQYFYPDLSSTGQVLTEIAEDLQSYGLSVQVITGLPNYEGRKEASKVALEESYQNIKIKRLNYFRLSKNSTIGRLIGWFSFSVSAFVSSIKVKDLDTVLIVTNPPILPLIGVLLKKLRNCKFCFLIHDIHPDIAVQIGHSKEGSIAVKVMDYITKTSLKHADKVIALGNDMKKRLIRKGTPAKNIVIIPNFADKTKIYPVLKDNDFALEYDLTNKFVLLYSGNIGLYYNLEYLLSVAENLQDIDNLILLFVGDGGKKSELLDSVSQKKLKNVMFLPYQPWGKFNSVLNSADILLVTLSKGVEGISVPSKMYSYMASGKPIAGMINRDSDIGMLIEESDCGFRVDSGDVDGFCMQIRRLYEDKDERKRLGLNAFNTFLTHYERKNVTHQFLDLVEPKIFVDIQKKGN